MCAPGNGSIRLRLFFDYPPPAVVSCRKCWLLVDLNTCRVVADLESVIRDKFEFSRGSILSLFIEDCYLPHTESILVVRDNDSVRVKVDCLTNGHNSCPETTRETCRKRPRTTEEDGPAENGVGVEWKKKKRKKRSEETTEEAKKLVSGDDGEKKLQKKHTEKKKKKKVEKVSPTVKPAASPKKPPTSISKPAKSSKKVQAAKPQKPSSSDSSSSSEEDEPPRNTKTPSSSTRTATKPASSSTATKPASSSTATKPASSSSTATKPASSSTATKPASSSSTAAKPSSSSSTATKTPPNSKPVQKKPRPPPSSSSETDSSSSDEDPEVKTKPLPALTTRSQPAPSVLESTNCEQKQAGGPPQDSDSEEDIQLVIRRPLLPAGFGVGSPGRGRGRGQGRRGGGGERARGGGIRGSFRATETSYETDLLSNVSVVLQNGVQDAPRRDYSSLPLLAAPPPVGQNIAFKLLELTENYTPEVSEYKEGKIVSFDPTTKQIELELLNSSQAPVEPGKFDLVYQNPDGSESVEYAVSRGSWVTERWESLLEPRLII